MLRVGAVWIGLVLFATGNVAAQDEIAEAPAMASVAGTLNPIQLRPSPALGAERPMPAASVPASTDRASDPGTKAATLRLDTRLTGAVSQEFSTSFRQSLMGVELNRDGIVRARQMHVVDGQVILLGDMQHGVEEGVADRAALAKPGEDAGRPASGF